MTQVRLRLSDSRGRGNFGVHSSSISGGEPGASATGVDSVHTLRSLTLPARLPLLPASCAGVGSSAANSATIRPALGRYARLPTRFGLRLLRGGCVAADWWATRKSRDSRLAAKGPDGSRRRLAPANEYVRDSSQAELLGFARELVPPGPIPQDWEERAVPTWWLPRAL